MTKSWDDWVPQDRVRKFTPENKELAAQLHNQMKLLQQKAPKSVGKGQGKRGANGSEISSQRDSEERMGSVAATGRGGRGRNRDYDLEHVSTSLSFCFARYQLDLVVTESLLLAFVTHFSPSWVDGLTRRPRRVLFVDTFSYIFLSHGLGTALDIILSFKPNKALSWVYWS
jgi:hypothetical protein